MMLCEICAGIFIIILGLNKIRKCNNPDNIFGGNYGQDDCNGPGRHVIA